MATSLPYAGMTRIRFQGYLSLTGQRPARPLAVNRKVADL
jgi:hypothetical protein